MRRGSLRIGARGLDAKNGGEIFAAITYAERCRKVQIWSRFAPQPNGDFSDEAICAGLDGAANLKIAASSGGRANRPYQNEHRAPPCGHFVRAAHGFPSKHSFFGASPRKKPSLYKHSTHSPPTLPTSVSSADHLPHLRCRPPSPALLTPATSVADFSHKGTQSFSCLRLVVSVTLRPLRSLRLKKVNSRSRTMEDCF